MLVVLVIYRAVDDGLGGDAALATTTIYAQYIRDDTIYEEQQLALDGDPVKLTDNSPEKYLLYKIA